MKHLGFFDHNPCPFEMLPKICACIEEWLDLDPRHVVAVHCKAGKGRTGMVLACWLVHSRECTTADEERRPPPLHAPRATRRTYR